LFCAIFLVSASVVIFPVRQSYFFGSRGLLEAANRPLNLGWALSKEGREIVSGFFLCIPLIVAGVLEIFRRKQYRPLAFALLILWLATFFSAEKIDDVSPQLPVYAMLCVVGGLGFSLLLKISDSRIYIKFAVYAAVIAVIVAVFINGFDAFKKILASNKYRTEYRNTVMRISKIAAPDYLVMGNWERCVLFEHYVFQKSFTPYCINFEWLDGYWGREQQDKSIKKFNQAIAAHRQIWLLEDHYFAMAKLRQNNYKITRFDSAKLFDSEKLIPICVANAKE
jgi:hypothetical protein